MSTNSRKRTRKRRRKQYKPTASKIIRTQRWCVDLVKLVFVGLILFGVFMTLKCNYYMKRASILETSIDSFYEEDQVSDIRKLDQLDTKMAEIADVYKLTLNNYLEVKEENSKLEDKFTDLVKDCLMLDYENIQLVEANENYYNELAEYKEREELYDKYEYAIMHNEERTDITYEQLKTGVDIMEENNIDPNILFGIIMTESKGNEDAKNATSTASGYGQILQSTGKSVYERYMNNGSGTFDPEMLFDGVTNIEISANYIAQLVENSGTLTQALYKYRGYEDQSWLNSVNSYCQLGGTNITKISQSIYN